ncbi:MAG: prolyl oligopeptidase family serine peptidase [Planctomycetes bacterium]|nr:prolyl oligopeptidase family serine peptidase [Planctomycetota bacterium]
MSRPWFLTRLTCAGLFLLGGVALAAPPDDRQKQIEEIEKQLAELRQKLAKLKQDEAKPAAKKPLTLAEAETWRAIRRDALSGDGKWFAYRIGPAEGNGEVVLRNNGDGKEKRFPAGGDVFGALQFSHDSKWLAFTATPYVKPSSPPTPSADRPKSKVVLVNLATGEKSEVEGMSSFRFSGEAATCIALRKTPDLGAGPLGLIGPLLPAAAAQLAASDLVLRELATGTDLVFGNVIEFGFDKKGNWLVTLIDAAGQVGNGVHLRDMKTGTVIPLDSAKATYRGLVWNEETTTFTVTRAVEEPGYEDKWISIIGFTDLGPKPTKTVYDPKGDKDFPKDMAISKNRPATWTDGLDAFSFAITERKKKDDKKDTATAPKDPSKKDDKKEEKKGEAKKGPPATGAAPSPKPDLVIWHWKDERLQPMQQKQADADRQFAYTCLYKVKEKKFLRLADDSLRQVTLAPKHRYAIGRHTKPYEYMSYLNGKLYTDVYVIDLKTGEKKKAVGKLASLFMGGAAVYPSPTGTHFLYYHDGHYYAYDMAAGKETNVTAPVTGTSFVNTEDDHNFDKPPTPMLGWSRDGKSVLLSDAWDIWQVHADGTGGTNLTQNGKAEQIRYRGLQQFEPQPKPGIDLTQPLYLSLYGEWTKKSGVGRIDSGKPGVNVLLWGDCRYGLPQKARDAEVFAYTRQTLADYPDSFLTDATFKNSKKVTEANPQQKEYQWSAGARLIEYKGTGSKRLQGALFLPANYEPGKKYPTIVYIYEKLSQGLHQYNAPSNFGFSEAIYTSNGYAVLMPDIAYRLNDPGKASVECILPALDAAIATGIVDADKMALHGHSWGGYQTAFAVTQTDRFKCAIAGAPLTDLVSMYSSVYWNVGMANQPIFESSQGRFTGGYWDLQDAYIRNSPVFFAKNVKTPLVILHNDKDGAVDFTQGIEYYNTLRRLQKPVVMLQYKGENHGVAKPENRKDYAMRMREFFDHHLLGKPAPDWWAEGVPHLKMDDHLKKRKP